MSNFRDFMSTFDLKRATAFDSPSLFKEMAILNPNTLNKIQSALQFITKNHIDGIIIGGVAVSHYVHDRPLTPDIDFLAKDLENVKLILQQSNIKFRALASTTGDYGGIFVPEIDADFLDANVGNVGLQTYALRTSKRAMIGGVLVPIIDPCVLAIMKLEIGRTKDLEDAFKLLAIAHKDVMRAHLKAVSKFLTGDMNAKMIWSYCQAICQS